MPATLAPPAPPPPKSTPPPPPKTPAPPEPPGPTDDLYEADAEIDALEPGGEGSGESGSGEAGTGTKPPPKEEGEGQQPPEPGSKEAEDKEIDDLELVETPEQKAAREKEAQAGKKDDTQQPIKTRDLKVVYEKLKADHQALTAKHTELATQLETARKANPDEIKALTQRLEASEASRKELESELRFTNYAKHPEFVEKYEKPYQEAWNQALADIGELEVALPDGNVRKAKADDLVELCTLPLGQARARAVEMFGAAAEDAIAHRRIIIDLGRKQEKALADSRKMAEERQKTQLAENVKRQEKLSSLWQAENTRLEAAYPKWFKPVEGDTAGNAILEKGIAEVDRFFNDKTMTDEDRIKAHVMIRMKAANHGRMALRVKRLLGRVKKLSEELKAYQNSSPPGGKPRGKPSAPHLNIFEEANAEIEALDEGQS